MDKISPQIQDMIDTSGPFRDKRLNLIITLAESSDWEEGVSLVLEAGLEIASKVEEIKIVSGTASPTVIRRLAELPA